MTIHHLFTYINTTVLAAFMVWQFLTVEPNDVLKAVQTIAAEQAKQHGEIITKINRAQASIDSINSWTITHAKTEGSNSSL